MNTLHNKEIVSNIEDMVSNAKIHIEKASDISALENLRIKYLGKKGYLSLQTKNLRTLPAEEKAKIGVIVNSAKKTVQQALKERKEDLEKDTLTTLLAAEAIDVSLPGRRIESGNLHPVTKTIDCIEHFFCEAGFILTNSQEIEDDYHNFDALNIPEHHPARTSHDTFWLDSKRLLRTQTSGVQIRAMKIQPPPIRIIASGRVYRNDFDQTHTPMFHQMEGLVVDERVNFSNLKSIMHDFLVFFFERDIQIRFRPSYFPFTRPSIEIDIMHENKKWIEVLGCGMVHPKVLHNVGIDSEIYSGFAFGIGIERLTMLRYYITDLRAFFENDLRFLKQFK